VFILAGIAPDGDVYLVLIVGVREGRALRFAGTVGFGVTRRLVDSLYPQIEPLVRATSPFRERLRFADCVWLAAAARRADVLGAGQGPAARSGVQARRRVVRACGRADERMAAVRGFGSTR
jgi:hypothetical protein